MVWPSHFGPLNLVLRPLSQIALGWYMAWEAVDAVFDNNKKKKNLVVAPMLDIDGYGLMASANW